MRMIQDWLVQGNLVNDFEDRTYKIEEEGRSSNLVPNLAEEYLNANVDPDRIERKIRRLQQSSRDLGLEEIEGILQRFITESVIPRSDRKGTRSGLFGEFLSEEVMVEINGYHRLIYKLRHREASDWAPKLIDICVIKRNSTVNLCLMEVKTNSSQTKNNILANGLESLLTSLERKYEALTFISRELEKQRRFEEAYFVDDLANFDEYEQRNEIFLIVDSKCWDKDALKKLSTHEERDKIPNLCVRVVLIDNLGEMVEDVHEKALEIGSEVQNEEE